MSESAFSSKFTQHNKSQTVKARNQNFFKRMFKTPTMCHMSGVICHVSYVTCHMSFVICHVSGVTFNFFLLQSIGPLGWWFLNVEMSVCESVCLSFCLFVCLSVHFKVPFKRQMFEVFRDSESLKKSAGNMWSQIWIKITLKGC